MFVYNYNDTVFDSPDADNKTVFVNANKIAQVRGRDGGWTSFGVGDVEGVECEKFISF